MLRLNLPKSSCWSPEVRAPVAPSHDHVLPFGCGCIPWLPFLRETGSELALLGQSWPYLAFYRQVSPRGSGNCDMQ